MIEETKREKLQPMKPVDKYMFLFLQDVEALKDQEAEHPAQGLHERPKHDRDDEKADRERLRLRHDGNVYFDASTFPEYSKLSRIKYEEPVKHKIKPGPRKRNLADFAL